MTCSFFRNLVCALDVDHRSSVLCNTIGYSNLSVSAKPTSGPGEEDKTKTRYQRRQHVHQWISIQDIVDGLITCNHILKYKDINEILIEMDLWLKSKTNEVKSEVTTTVMTNIKSLKANARQLVWDLMEMK